MEQSEVLEVSKKNTMEYVNHQKKLRKIVANLTSEKAFEISLDKREFYRLKKKLKRNDHIVLRKNTLEKLSGF